LRRTIAAAAALAALGLAAVPSAADSRESWNTHEKCQVDFVVTVRYAKETDDSRYTAPGRKGKIGVITAYCRGVQKCPSWGNS
jgi:hypothetical protein